MKVKFAATQMSISWDIEANIKKASNMVRKCAKDGANVILLQELFQTPYFCQKEKYEYFDLAIENILESDFYKVFSNLAKELNVVIPLSFFEKSGVAYYNSIVVIDADGTQNVTETGHKAEDDPEDIVKVDIKKKKIDSVTIKFRYSIRVTNEGQIAGYAKEIKDYIPDGLKFIAEDNPTWTALDEKTIVTDSAKDILLKPGESTEVEVILTWENSAENMKVMDNWAEISKDYNEYGSPDIDSTPNNRKEGEDDIDDAPVLVTVQTGQIQLYLGITFIVLVIVLSGVTLIKKFVL